MPEELAERIAQQSGVVNRSQLLAAGYDRRSIATQLNSNSWQQVTSRVISVGPNAWNRRAELWVAALHYPNAALTGVSALELRGFSGSLGAPIDLVSRENLRHPPLHNIRLHHRSDMEVRQSRPRAVSDVIATVDAIRSSASTKQGCFYAVWSIQRRFVTLEELSSEFQRTCKMNGSHKVGRVLKRLDTGLEAISELEFARLCRRAGIPVPHRQQRRVDSEGRTRYLDAVWEVGQKTIVVEIDGLGHLDYRVRMDDQFRDNSMALQRATTLRIPALALRLEPERWMLQIRDALS